MKIHRPAKYKNGMARLYIIIMNQVAMIKAYLTVN